MFHLAYIAGAYHRWVGATPKDSFDHTQTATDPEAFVHLLEWMREEMLEHLDNGCVGSILVSETDRVRVWLAFSDCTWKTKILLNLPNDTEHWQPDHTITHK